MKKVYLTQCSSFTARHGHKGTLNEASHEHHFTYQVIFYGPLNPEGFLIDFREVQQFLQERINTTLDQADLNTLFTNPTTENIAIWIFEQTRARFAQLVRVRVSEALDRWVEYEGEGRSGALAQAVLALGSNIAPAKENVDRAVQALAQLGEVKTVSPYILSKPEGFENQSDFINAVVILQTSLGPMELLKKLKEVESELGRTPTFPNGPRVIDLDILFYNDQVLFEDDDHFPLFIPHPRLHEREFVLKPLSYILPDFVHPKLQQPIYQLYRDLMKKKGTPTCRIL